jgi:hypothetical protein
MGSIAQAFDGRRLILVTEIIVADQSRDVQFPVGCGFFSSRELFGKATPHAINVVRIASFTPASHGHHEETMPFLEWDGIAFNPTKARSRSRAAVPY